MNIKGPKTEPWGTPDSAMKGDEKIPEKRMLHCLLGSCRTN
jgi:hypothetical protein